MMKSTGGYEVPISTSVLEADFLIDVPKLKTHVLTGISVCIKNMFSIISGNAKARMHAQTGHANIFPLFLVDVYVFRPRDFNIVDAGIGTVWNPKRIEKIIANFNAAEVDTVCPHMMGFQDPRHIKLLEFALTYSDY